LYAYNTISGEEIDAACEEWEMSLPERPSKAWNCL
jgi:hypothetical protein